MATYGYDAWGNHWIKNAMGQESEDPEFIGNVNPIRYRGYYYDTETKLYYLKSRYYDPEVGRFITIDDISYLDPETINGLNLYAYCGNNPVMNVDPNGNLFFLFSLLIGIAAGALIGGTIGGVTAYFKGESFWGGVISGALIGGVLGGALITGGATMLAIAGKTVSGFIVASTLVGKTALVAGMAATVFNASMVAGSFAYAINESINGRQVNLSEMLRQGITTGIKGINAFIVGAMIATTGLYNNLLVNGKLTLSQKIIRSVISTIFQFTWRQGLK